MPYYHFPRYSGIYHPPTSSVLVNHYNFQPFWLPQVSLSTVSWLHDTAASTTLTQTFINPNSHPVEKAKYSFPLYESCVVVSFRCYVGKRLIEGVVRENHQAKVEYQAAVDQGETAGLLEQVTPDVFTTSLGNIPAGETIKVEVEYIMELKHDAQIDGLRFTIPTSIAPRYGSSPSGITTSYYGQPTSGAMEKGGMRISVQVSMPSNVRSVQSPSHTISMHLGGHIEDVADDEFNPMHALATLSQTSTELDQDFVLLIKCADLSTPRALLKTHPIIANSKALMITVVPKFELPQGPKPEIVFVVDRSGSMDGRMAPLKSSLEVFLKSIPVGTKFNICSFGSGHSFLWEKSQSYSAETLDHAMKHVAGMSADFGGTELLPPIKSTFSRRYKDLHLEIMVLTDGEVWNSEELFTFVEKETVEGDARVFTLGIGRDVSRALVEGLARVGRGFAQIVMDEKEGMEGKFVRMLRGGLSAHINDYRLEWDGKPPRGVAGTSSPPASTITKMKQKISLFNTQANVDAPISKSTNPVERFNHLPEFDVPSVLQAPYRIPPLFPFSRSTAYAILAGDTAVPSTVWLKGTTPDGDELELEINVQVILEKAKTIHQLAARNILQELEEGTGYIHSGEYGVDKTKNPGTFGDWVDREGIRVGLQYGLASKWTSFVALQNKATVKEKEKERGDGRDDATLVDKESVGREQKTDVDKIDGVDDDEADEEFELLEDEGEVDDLVAGDPAPAPGTGGMDRIKMKAGMGPRKRVLAAPSPIVNKSSEHNVLASSFAPLASMSRSRPAASASFGGIGGMSAQPTGYVSPSGRGGGGGGYGVPSPPSGPALGDASHFSQRYAPSPSMSFRTAPPPPSSPRAQMYSVQQQQQQRAAYLAGAAQSQAPVVSSRDRTNALIGLQTFEGSFPLSRTLAGLLGVSEGDLQRKLTQFTNVSLSPEQKEKLWATILAVVMFEEKLRSEKDLWELVVEKAHGWISGIVGNEDLKGLKKLASETVA